MTLNVERVDLGALNLGRFKERMKIIYSNDSMQREWKQLSFPDFASHTGCFRLIFVPISSVVSFWVDDIRQLSLFLICRLFSLIKMRLSVSFPYLFNFWF